MELTEEQKKEVWAKVDRVRALANQLDPGSSDAYWVGIARGAEHVGELITHEFRY